MFDSIKTRLIALGVGIVALTLLAITVANYVTVRGHTRQQATGTSQGARSCSTRSRPG